MSQFADADGAPLVGAKRNADALSEAGDEKSAVPEASHLPDSLKEGWIACPRLGQLVGHGPFIPCKPILAGPANALLDEGDRFDSNMFMERQVCNEPRPPLPPKPLIPTQTPPESRNPEGPDR